MLEESMPDTFAGLIKHMDKYASQWSKIVASATPYNEDLPGAWNYKVRQLHF